MPQPEDRMGRLSLPDISHARVERGSMLGVPDLICVHVHYVFLHSCACMIYIFVYTLSIHMSRNCF